MLLPELTVVVTTFKRSERLRNCLKSLVAAGVERVVVAGSASTEADQKVCLEFPTLKITRSFFAGDLGCNECWLRGVSLAETKFVLILHDDDWLLPDFWARYAGEIYPQLQRGVGFATWRGQVVDDTGKVVDDTVGCLKGETRVASAGSVTDIVMIGGTTSPSPVISVFRRDICIRALREADLYFQGIEHHTRAKMMVGNDLLLYLRHAEQFDSWFFLNRILTCHGGHYGSETAKHQAPIKFKKFVSIYDAARNHFLKTRVSRVPVTQKFYHLVTAYTPTDKDALRRINFARSTWDFMYAWGECYSLPVRDGVFRDSKQVVGDTRSLPFLRDMLDYGARIALDEDIIIFTNDDSCLVPDVLDKLRHRFNSGANALFSWRHNIHYPLTQPLKDLRAGHRDGGVDLLAFRPEIWRRYRHQFPDFIVGCEAWDYCYRVLIPELPGGGELDGILYHEFHDPIWRQDAIRTSNPGQRYNRQLARNFFTRRGESHDSIPKFKDL